MSLIQDSVPKNVGRLLATVSAHVILVDRRGGCRILLGRLAYRDHRWGKWSFPGGYMDYGEEPEISLCREVREETGVELLGWERVHVQPLLHLEHPHISFLYLSDLWRGDPVCLTREFLELQWVDEGFYRRLVQEEGLAYPCMRDQVVHVGWRFGSV